MDPNANLREQRRIIARIQEGQDTDARVTHEDAVDMYRLAELVQALDEWITKGGFLPDAWQI